MWLIGRKKYGVTSDGMSVEVRRNLWGTTLWVDNYLQSGSVLVGWWKSVIKKIKWDVAPQRVLILGLGGGDLVRIVQRVAPRSKIVVVEKEKLIVEVARREFGIGSKYPAKIVIQDAKAYMKTAPIYDLIIVDLYDGSRVIDLVTSPTLIKQVRRSLSANGMLIVNYGTVVSHADYNKYLDLIHRSIGQTTIHNYNGHLYITCPRLHEMPAFRPENRS